MVGLFGGVFDPPHNGHVALARAALEQLALERLRVLVAVSPGHKGVEADGKARLRLAAAAFAALPRTTVEPEPHARTVDMLEGSDFGDSIFLVGADEWLDFADWKNPQRVLELTRLGVATRPGYAIEIPPDRRDRVVAFEVEPVPISSTEIRARVARGESIDRLVPPEVARLIGELGLYRRSVR